MMNNLKFSIITASYNSARTIADTLNSVLNQTYTNFEYIIIDGASKDETVNIIKEYAPRFKGKLKWISEEDNGIYDAWNKGICNSTGNWICFIGSDDILKPYALEKYADVIKKEPSCNFVSSKICIVTNGLKPVRVCGERWSKKMINYCVVAHVGSCHKRELFTIFGKYNTRYKISADYDFLLRCYNNIIPAYVDDVLALMRDGGVSNNRALEALSETRKIKKKNSICSNFKCDIFYLYAVAVHYFRKLSSCYL